ncbi:MAG TPA: cell division protein FtsK, partial [Mizugakiibacter sp.]|nr:cell division protein FtsK [Mizugakiibacter sp.]
MVRGVKNHTATTARPGISQAVRHVLREACALLLLPLAIYLFLSLVTRNPADPSWSHSGPVVLVHNLGGRVGAYLADSFFEIFGIVAYVFPLLLVWLAIRVLRSAPVAARSAYEPTLKLIGLVSFVLAAAALATLAGGPQSSLVGTGGILGKQAAGLLAGGLGETGAVLLLFALCLVGITLATGFSWF